MNENTRTNKAELLKEAPRAFQFINNIFHVDFNADYEIVKANNAFTVNTIKKEATAAGYKPEESEIILLVKGTRAWDCDKLQILELENDKFNYSFRDIFRNKRTYPPRPLDDFYTRKDAEEARKKAAYTYIILQKKENATPENPHTVNRCERFKYISNETYNNGEYVTRVHTTRTDDNGSGYTINDHGQYVYTSQLEKYRTLAEIIDKSGYITMDKRENLKRRAAALKAEREKAAYIETDNAGKIAELWKQANAKKLEIAEELKNATTGEQIARIGDKLWKYNALGGIYKSLERLEERDNEKQYKSIETFEAAAADIENALKNL